MSTFSTPLPWNPADHARPAADLQQRFIAYRAELLAYLTALAGDSHLAEDAAQEVWVAIADGASEIQHFEAWCRAVGRHVVLRRWRELRRLRPDDEVIARQIDDAFAVDLEPASRSEARIAALVACVGALRSSLRELITRHYHAEVPLNELAASQRQSAGALRMRLARIRQQLRACVERRLRESEP
jgi:RNA polymerase sigma-70 factor (ECF subfamily)